jgi:hypothetical protein
MPYMAARRAIIALICCAGPLAAQDEFEMPKKELFVSVGGSLGSAGISCIPKCGADRLSGPSFFVRGAGQLSSQFFITLEATSWSQGFATPDGKGRWTLNWYMIGSVWHPNEEEDFFINAALGFGVGRANVTFPTGTYPLNFSDVGGTVGAGRDFRFSDHYGVTAFVQYHVIGRSQGLIGRANSGAKVAADVVSAGLAFTLF